LRKSRKKTFILDTNVILHDSSCIHQFQEHDIVIPITVLEELDQFKKGNGSLNYHAREFLRAIDELSGDHLFGNGACIGPKKGKLSIQLEGEFHEDILSHFSTPKADHKILNIAYRMAKKHPSGQVILVTKDVNLRMKAKALGIVAQNYTTNQVEDISALYTGRRIEENISAEAIDRLYRIPFEIEPSELTLKKELIPNEYLILKNGRKSALGVYVAGPDKIRRVDKTNVYGITPLNAEQTFALDALTNTDIRLVSVSGKAGTGKTLLALCAAMERRRSYRQIYVSRPVVPLSNKDLGYLPGDIQSKLDPYMQPLYDNLAVIQNRFYSTDRNNQRIKEFLESEKLVITPLPYIRGRSLVKIFFIVDEAQNLTPHEVKTIITRAGEDTKIVFTGDIFQIDHPYLDSHTNGLSYLIEKMQGQKLYAHITLEKGERSELAELASDLL
jgi:PhoH-like ATPase